MKHSMNLKNNSKLLQIHEWKLKILIETFSYFFLIWIKSNEFTFLKILSSLAWILEEKSKKVSPQSFEFHGSNQYIRL